jgi:hypothetical protein
MSETIDNIYTALIQAKTNFKPVLKNRTNPHYKSKYADLDSVLEAIGSALSEAGLLLIQPTEISENGTILKTVLIHAKTGDRLESAVLIPNNNDPQKFGSALTYYRRFCLCALLGIAPEEDDDGNKAIPVKTQPPPRVETKPKSLTPLPPTDRKDRLKELKEEVLEKLEILEYSDEEKYHWGNKLHGIPSSEWTIPQWSIASTDLQDRIDAAGKTQDLIEAGAD